MKQTITKLYRSFKDKQGNPLKTKDGRPYERVAIKTQEYGDKFISGFGSDYNNNWKIGDTIDIKIEPKGEYLNFSKIDRIDELEARIEALENRNLNIGVNLRGANLRDYNPEMIEKDRLNNPENNPEFENQEENEFPF